MCIVRVLLAVCMYWWGRRCRCRRALFWFFATERALLSVSLCVFGFVQQCICAPTVLVGVCVCLWLCARFACICTLAARSGADVAVAAIFCAKAKPKRTRTIRLALQLRRSRGIFLRVSRPASGHFHPYPRIQVSTSASSYSISVSISGGGAGVPHNQRAAATTPSTSTAALALALAMWLWGPSSLAIFARTLQQKTAKRETSCGAFFCSSGSRCLPVLACPESNWAVLPGSGSSRQQTAGKAHQ